MSKAEKKAPAEVESDVLASLSSELEEAEAKLERAAAQHAELCGVLGKPARAGVSAKRSEARPKAGAYRGPDARAALEQALREANSAVASLEIENAILASRAEKLAPKSDGTMRAVVLVLSAIAVLGTGLAFVVSPSTGGPVMLILVTICIALYALFGWFLVLSSLSSYRTARRVLAREISPIGTAPTGRTIAVRGVVQGRETSFEAWYPEGERAVWQEVEVIDQTGRRRQQLATRKREAQFFYVADDDGARVRVELAGAELVPEEFSALGRTLSRAGKRELDAIPGILGEREYLTIIIRLVRLGVTVQLEGRITHDPEPVMRSTRDAPLHLVVLDRRGVDAATRDVRHGLRVGLIASPIAAAAILVLTELIR